MELILSPDVQIGSFSLVGCPFVAHRKVFATVRCVACGEAQSALLTEFVAESVKCAACGQRAPKARKPVSHPKGERFNVGMAFGEWRVVADASDETPFSRRRVRCRCSCGEEHDVLASNLLSGRSLRCSNCAPAARAGSRTGVVLPRHIQYARDMVNTIHSGCTSPSSPYWDTLGGKGVEFRFPSLQAAYSWADSVARSGTRIRLRMIDPKNHFDPTNLEVTYADD